MNSEQSTPNTSDIEDGYGTAPDDQPTQPYTVSGAAEHKAANEERKKREKGEAPMPGGRKKKRRKSRRKRKSKRKSKSKRKRRKTRRKRKKTRRKRKRRRRRTRRKLQHGGAGGVELENWRPNNTYGFIKAADFTSKIPADSYPSYTANPSINCVT